MPKEKKIEKKALKVKAVKAVSRPVEAVKKEKAKKAEKIAPKVEEKIEKPKVAEKPQKKAKKSTAPQKDTGSVDFQINNFSQKIASLAKHLKIHSHDFDSRRGLLIMVGKRRRLLNYVKKNEPEKYESLAKSLKLKK